MLGESALTEPDALRYLESYRAAIEAVGRSVTRRQPARGLAEHLGQALGAASALRVRAPGPGARRSSARGSSRSRSRRSQAGIALTVDAEEADRLELSLLLIDRLLDAPGARRLGRARACGAGVFEARAGRAALPAAARRRGRPRAERPAREGRVLGQRDQARPGARPAGLSGLHAQAEHGRRLSRLRAHPAGGHAPRVSAVRDAQRAHGGVHHPPGRGARPGIRVPAPARHGRGALRGAHRPGGPRLAVPRLRAGRLARGPAAVPGAAPARERREYLVRQPHRRRVAAGRGRGRRSGRRRRAAGSGPHPRIPLPRGLFGAERRELRRHQPRRRRGAAPPGGRLPRGAREAARLRGQSSAARSRRASAGNAVRRRTSRGWSAWRPRRMQRSPRARSRLAAAAQPEWDRVPAATRARMLRDAADRLERDTARFVGALRRRGRQDRARLDRGSARGGRFPALLRGARGRVLRPRARAAGPDRRIEPARPARPRRIRLHQSLELPARDLHRPG